MYDVTVIGGGIVGCAVASVLSHKYSVVLLEKNGNVGLETSYYSGEVIHSGINYLDHPKKGSFCRQANRLMYEWCDKFGVKYKRWGKFLVGRKGQESEVEALHKKGVDAGIELYLCNEADVKEFEPNLSAEGGAIWSPNTGIVDTAGLIKSYLAAADASNFNVYFKREVVGVDKIPGGFSIAVAGDEGRIKSTFVVNAAGLFADEVAKMCGIDDPEYEIHFCKGNYLSVRVPKAKRLNHLVYPMPGPVSQGFHVKLELDHQMKIGPDANFIDKSELDYNPNVDFAKVQPQGFEFTQQNMPLLGIKMDDITPGYTGVRPKRQKPGGPSKDWIIREESDRGLPGLVSIIGSDSPFMTSAMIGARHIGSELFGIKKFL